MNLLNLQQFFLGKVSVDEIINEIDAEIDSFRVARSKTGSSSPVYVTNENFQFTLKEKDLEKLCKAYLSGKLNEWHLEYLCNLMELSPAFSTANEKVEEAVFELSSPEINSPITPDSVKRICANLWN